MLGVFRTQVLGVGSPGSAVVLIIINVSIIHRPLCPGVDPEKILAAAPSERVKVCLLLYERSPH